MMNKFFLSTIAGAAAAAFLVLPTLASASVVYDALPTPLPANAPSVGFQATQTAQFGDYVHLAGTDRTLTTVTVTMSDWALFADYSLDVRYSGNSATWTHPITINVYSNHLDANGVPDTLLATKTQDVTIPWRPVADPTCAGGTAWRAGDGNCYNGLAFNTTFDLTSLNVTLPNDVIVGISYNTQTWGAAPIGSAGPYNSLNLAVPASQPVAVGSDDNVDNVFWNTSTAANYTDGGVGGVGTFRQDTNWTPNGTVALQINAITPVPPQVHTFKYVNGAQATAGNANSAIFPMVTTFNSSTNGNVVDAPFTLSPTGWGSTDAAYEASYVGGAFGDDYATHEVTGGAVVGASCADGKPFALNGYTTGDTLVAAAGATPSATIPSFTNLQSDHYVIVWNKTCTPPTVPTITSPTVNSCVTSANQQLIDWTDSSGVAPITYQYQAFSDSAYTASIYDSGMTLTSSQIPTPGTSAGVYYIRIRAQDGNGNVSDWSNGPSSPYKIVVGPDTFTWSQLLSPLNISGKTFNTGSTIPVKVQITDGCGVGVNKGLPTLTITGGSLTSAVTGPFRFDSSAGQYIFNWNTKSPTALKVGTYTITVGAGPVSGVTSAPPSTTARLVK